MRMHFANELKLLCTKQQRPTTLERSRLQQAKVVQQFTRKSSIQLKQFFFPRDDALQVPDGVVVYRHECTFQWPTNFHDQEALAKFLS